MVQPQNIKLEECYYNFYDYRNAVQRWSLDHTLLDAGQFYGYISLLDFGNVQVIKTGLSGSVLHRGEIPPGHRTLLIPAEANQSTIWFNKKVEQDCIYVFPKSDTTIDATTYQNFNFYTVSIEDNHFERCMRDCNATNLYNTLTDQECTFSINKFHIHYISSFIQILFNRIRQKPDLVNSESFINSVKYKLPYLLINIMNRRSLILQPEFNSKSAIAFNNSVEYILRNIKRNISVKELSKFSGVSARTLELVFSERFGVSPKKFIKSARLNKLKWEIYQSSGSRTVSDIAKQYGFNHLGQLSDDYQTFFGESPKQTIRSVRKD